jgi:putative Holliday junction resolvase
MARAGAVIAIDHGTKRTGFAVADPLRITIQPIGNFEGPGSGRELIDHIASLVGERDVAVFLVGLPQHADGSLGARALEVGAFIERLRARFSSIEVIPYDEHLSTKAAEDLLREAGFHGQHRKARRDSWSALVILRDWIAAGEPR